MTNSPPCPVTNRVLPFRSKSQESLSTPFNLQCRNGTFLVPQRVKNLPTIFDAMFPAKFPLRNELPARLDAWLNLSHREKASVFIIVKTRAITTTWQDQ
jgi:hypothetical protein